MSLIEINTHVDIDIESHQKDTSFLMGCSGVYCSSSVMINYLLSSLVSNNYIPIQGVNAFGYPQIEIYTRDRLKIALIVIYEMTPNYLRETDQINIFFHQGAPVSEDSCHQGSSISVHLLCQDTSAYSILPFIQNTVQSMSKLKN